MKSEKLKKGRIYDYELVGSSAQRIGNDKSSPVLLDTPPLYFGTRTNWKWGVETKKNRPDCSRRFFGTFIFSIIPDPGQS